MNTGVSVIICCYNSSMLLEETLNHIAGQNIEADLKCEVILVDNASTDDTSQKAELFWKDKNHGNIKLIVVDESQPGLAYARQKGIDTAQYEYLIFCDDDNRLDKTYISNVFNLFNRHTDVAILGGTGIALLEDEKSKPAWFDKYYQSYAIGPQAAGEAEADSVYGAGMAVRKSILKQVMDALPMLLQGRKQNILTAGEDSEICFRVRLAGYKILFSPKLTFTHFLTNKRINWNYLLRLHAGLAQSYVVIDLYKKALHSNQARLPTFYWLKKAFYYSVIYLKYWIKHYAAYKNTEGTIEEIYHVTWKNIALGYFEYNFKTVPMYHKIAVLRTKNP